MTRTTYPLLVRKARVEPKPKHLDRQNNFDFLRVVFALSVIISHAFPLYGLPITDDWLYKATGTVEFSDLGLGGFFCISGYLVSQSASRSPGYRNFIWKRVLRIFPGLIVMTLLTALISGAVAVGSWSYYGNLSVYSYILRDILLFNIQYTIPGVFESNPTPGIINGSLWTIPYEFLFYLLFFVFFINARITKLVKLGCVALFPLLFAIRLRYPDMGYHLPGTTIIANLTVHFALWFIAGMLLSFSYEYWKKYKRQIAAVSFAMLLLLFTHMMPFQALYIIFPVFVLSFGTMRSPIISRLDKIGDPSYGIYIYGYVIQQSLIYFFSPDFAGFLIASLLLSIAFGYASWYGIEKRALRMKKKQSIGIIIPVAAVLLLTFCQ